MDQLEPLAIPGGAGLSEPSGSRGWVLIDDGEPSRLGPALLSMTSRGVSSIEVLVDGSPSATGVVARRAAAFDGVAVWQVDGRSVDPASPALPLTDDAFEVDPVLRSALESHHLEVIYEHGVLRGEVLGLEVARTVGGHLEVGVGRYDRGARLEMRPGEDLHSALEQAADAVRQLRRPGAPAHPANTLARSRWLRALACAHPASLGVSQLEPVPPPLPWFDLSEVASSPAIGITESGRKVVAVFSVGVDPDLLPTAADCFAHYGSPEADLWLVLPQRDVLPVVTDLASRLRLKPSIHLVPTDWENLGGHVY